MQSTYSICSLMMFSLTSTHLLAQRPLPRFSLMGQPRICSPDPTFRHSKLDSSFPHPTGAPPGPRAGTSRGTPH
ncbi:hypothetical protein IE53DRAFT_251672 [Violaceomyces palustris]|uniref:Uncharacterized protein n=1 Tax=Violaceomyces palustris TaxID=1673888 RepID=A0ACD0NNR7_9BASI|nr:hypothetical protein IE53DRAFT_251672 [Violaceomyces palustris]